MSLKSPSGTALVVALLAIQLPVGSPAAARGLSGAFRANFIKIYGQGCMKAGLDDPDISKLPRATLVALCQCSGEYIADRVTPAQIDKSDSPETKAIEMEAARACLHQ